MEKIKKALEKYPRARVLDIGTGVGNFISILVSVTSDFQEIVGIDTSRKMLDRAQTNFAAYEFVRFEVADANHLPYNEATFDIICLSNSLHHLDDIIKILKEMKRVLQPNGIIIINEMVKDGLNNAQKSHMMLHHFAAEIDRRMNVVHYETYTKQEIVEHLNGVDGLAIESSWELSFPESEAPTAKDVNNLLYMIDKIMTPTQDFLDKEYFFHKGEEIKTYICKNSYASAPQHIFVLQHS
ncbi:MAG: class I SAM-dependent methyltransferase [Bacilli bacterium]|jgi:SAM-dependent methyltransferase|nr:class I SAM-dependent methyltransferase [Bacilli bacterium]MDD4056696.1 class I SAM-dependent methyltransferase [Bacilli bacterium]MDY0209348.1 class I SAM-dependent methyltransferase [Bacilli bacterium]